MVESESFLDSTRRMVESWLGLSYGWRVVEERLLSEGACCGGSEAGERRSERGDTAYSPRVPRGGAFGHRLTKRIAHFAWLSRGWETVVYAQGPRRILPLHSGGILSIMRT